jgi:acyl carrier protein
MNIEQFIEDFASVFEDTDRSEFSAQTVFKNLNEWDSLTTLAVIGLCNKKYGVKITGSEIREANTIEDIFNLVSSKK